MEKKDLQNIQTRILAEMCKHMRKVALNYLI